MFLFNIYLVFCMSWIPDRPQVVVTLSKSEFEEAKRKEANTKLIIFIAVVVFSIIFVGAINFYNSFQGNNLGTANQNNSSEGNILSCKLGKFTPQQGINIYQVYNTFSSGEGYTTTGEVMEHKISYCKVRYYDVYVSNLPVNEQQQNILDCEYALGNKLARKCELK